MLHPRLHLAKITPARKSLSKISEVSTGIADNQALVFPTAFQPRAGHIIRNARFHIGQVVKHRIYPFRGVIFDVDPTFDNTDEWYEAIPEHVRPRKDQPFYHLLAENEETEYIAYVSEQNLLPDDSDEPIRHPQVEEFFDGVDQGLYITRESQMH